MRIIKISQRIRLGREGGIYIDKCYKIISQS